MMRFLQDAGDCAGRQGAQDVVQLREQVNAELRRRMATQTQSLTEDEGVAKRLEEQLERVRRAVRELSLKAWLTDQRRPPYVADSWAVIDNYSRCWDELQQTYARIDARKRELYLVRITLYGGRALPTELPVR